MKRFLLIGLILLFFLTGCAGMDIAYQRDMTTNAGTWGVIGAATGAVIAIATKGKVLPSALLGGVIGAYAGAGNTPSPYGYGNGYGYGYGWRGGVDCSIFPQDSETRLQCERGREDTRQQLQSLERQRAYDYGRGYRY